MSITFEITHTCISIPNTYPHEVFNDSHKYFIFVSHICGDISFSSFMPITFEIKHTSVSLLKELRPIKC